MPYLNYNVNKVPILNRDYLKFVAEVVILEKFLLFKSYQHTPFIFSTF